MVLGLGRAILLGPAVDLAREIIAGLAEVAKADRDGIEHMELCQRLDLAGEDLSTIFRRLARQRRIPEHPAVFHRHDVEGRTDDAVVLAQRIGLRDRKALLSKRRDDPIFAIDRVRRRQQFAERLAAHHIGAVRRVEPVGRVGLAALELEHDQRALIAFDVVAQPGFEPHLVDAMTLLDRLGARELFVFPDAVSHDDAPSSVRT